MADTTITSANAVFTLAIPGLFDAPIQLSGFSTERAWNTDMQDQAEVQMGVDGRMTAGFTPQPVKQTISLQADSPSKKYINALAAAQKTARDIYYITGTITLPGTREVFAMVRGVLNSVKALPDAAKVLQPMEFVVTWQDVQGSVL